MTLARRFRAKSLLRLPKRGWMDGMDDACYYHRREIGPSAPFVLLFLFLMFVFPFFLIVYHFRFVRFS